MKIVTWNVNSLKSRAEQVATYLDRHAPDVLCLQEIKCLEDQVPVELFTSRGYQLEALGQKTYNGVLIAARAPLEDVHRGLEGGDQGQARVIAATVDGVRVVNLYCPQGSAVDSPKFAYKLGFYDRLIAWLGEVSDPTDPLVVTGDLNIAPDPEDVWSLELFEGEVSYHPEEHARWRRLVDWGLTDAARPHLPPRTFTFWDYRNLCFQKRRGMRIDHFLVTAPILARVTGAEVHRDERRSKDPQSGEKRKPSDHAPVQLTLT